MSVESKPEQTAEETLVGRASEGDLDAFNQLVLKYQDMAYNHAYSLLSDRALAEDAVQESFIKAFQSVAGFRGGSFRAWMLRIVTNSAYDILRQSKRRPVQPLFPAGENGEEIESPAWIADPNASVEETVEAGEEFQRLYQLLEELPEAFRTVINLIDVQEMDYAEVAHILKIPLGTVKSRLARARLQVKEKLQSEKHAILPILHSVRNTV